MAPPHPCASPGCPELVPHGRARCPAHTRSYDAQRGNSSQRGYGGQWLAIRAAHLAKHPACVVCGVVARSNNVDHVVAKRQGGTDDASNLQTLCRVHHSSKTATVDGGMGNECANSGSYSGTPRRPCSSRQITNQT